MRLSLIEENRLRGLAPTERAIERDRITQRVCESEASRQLILSGAGTGKTTLFAAKIEKWTRDGTDPSKILVTSFINFIVEDLRNTIPEPTRVYTLHKFAKMLIHRFLGAGGKFASPLSENFFVATDSDQLNIAEDILWLRNESDKTPKEIAASISRYFNSPSRNPKPDCLDTYLSLASFYDAVTFDDSILRAVRVVATKPEILDVEKAIIDEYQDFNDSEQRLVLDIFQSSGGGIIAGDDDQSIYSSRNANPVGIIGLYNSADWENWNLPFCSRCQAAAIVECAAVVSRKQERQNRIDRSFLPIADNGNRVKIVTLSQSSTKPDNVFLIEAEYIARIIDREKVRSWKPGEPPVYLILGVKNNHLKKIADVIQERLGEGIAVGTKEPDIYADRNVQILYSYLQLLNRPEANLPYRRLLGTANGDEKKEVALAAIQSGGFAKLENNTIQRIRENIERFRAIAEKPTDTEEKLWEISNELKLDSRNENLKAFIESVKTWPTIIQVLNRIEDLVVEQREHERKSLMGKPIQCLTIWSSKGLKADTVFVLGLEEGYLPRSNASPTDEEIRLLYVAMTRAVSNLYLLKCKSRYDGVHGGNNGFKEPSVFLDWLPEEHIEAQPDINKAALLSQ